MARYQYGLKPESPYPTKKEKCGCVRICPPDDGPVIDYCQRHILNEIKHVLNGLGGVIGDALENLSEDLKKSDITKL